MSSRSQVSRQGRGRQGAPSPLRVLHVLRPARGGMVTHVRLLCRGELERGLHVAVVAPPGFDVDQVGGVESPLWIEFGPCGGDRFPDDAGPFEEVPAELIEECESTSTGDTPTNRVPVFQAPIAARPHPFLDLRAAAEVARLARDYDLLHAHGLRAAWVGALAAPRASTPLVFTAHNVPPPKPGPLTRLLVRFVARRAAQAICVSRAVAIGLTEYGVAPEQMMVIANGIDLAPFDAVQPRGDVLRALGLPDDVRIVAAVGRLSPEKGFDVLTEAAPRVLERVPEAAFVLAGEGTERLRLEQLIVARGLAGRFLLPGRVENAASLLAAADAVAVPSRSEGQGIVALEAMAARRPVVASRVGGLPETVEDGVTGLLVPPEDPATLADALVRLLADAPLRQRLGDVGRRRVEERYTVARMVSRTIEVYSEVLGVEC